MLLGAKTPPPLWYKERAKPAVPITIPCYLLAAAPLPSQAKPWLSGNNSYRVIFVNCSKQWWQRFVWDQWALKKLFFSQYPFLSFGAFGYYYFLLDLPAQVSSLPLVTHSHCSKDCKKWARWLAMVKKWHGILCPAAQTVTGCAVLRMTCPIRGYHWPAQFEKDQWHVLNG
jgi:hypothetical protein